MGGEYPLQLLFGGGEAVLVEGVLLHAQGMEDVLQGIAVGMALAADAHVRPDGGGQPLQGLQQPGLLLFLAFLYLALE